MRTVTELSSVRNVKIFQNLQGGTFVKVTWVTLSKRDAYTETLRQILSSTFWKKYEHDF